ncbi:hypothetical protein, partial [Tritonibacter sp. SIMBA_163]|uniref:hypothetical protein n=1 Tax=Tritonibacter sp. SIMBA_163 TaxID=3080868 RepID=UPI0039804326
KLAEEDQIRLRIANALLIGPDWLVLDDILEGLEEETQHELAQVLSRMTDTTLIYIGRCSAFEAVAQPRLIHLQPLSFGTSETP